MNIEVKKISQVLDIFGCRGLMTKIKKIGKIKSLSREADKVVGIGNIGDNSVKPSLFIAIQVSTQSVVLNSRKAPDQNQFSLSSRYCPI